MAASKQCCKPMFWVYLLICAYLILFACLMSGLTLGLMSLSVIEVLAKAGQPQDRKNAAKILPVVKNQHLLLCTLLTGNSLAMELLDWLLGKGYFVLLRRAELKMLVVCMEMRGPLQGNLMLTASCAKQV